MPEPEQTINNQSPAGEIVSKLSEANNVLVTVSNNPSLDQLSACIGLTLALNKKGKHGTAVFSGKIPATLDFLEPDKTLEKNTDSLRDFIISLDKAKADKLRYKVEDEVVKIFITPYKTSISEADLEFGQGDFNIDVIVALGVQNKAELDAAIVAHGRILHDATIISINTVDGGELGSIHWVDKHSSSLSEMSADLVKSLDDTLFDSQISTAFLTGIVAETDRFRNEKAAPHTMSVSGLLMSAGASTQLVASKLEEPEPEIETTPPEDDEIPQNTEASENSGEQKEDISLPEPQDKPAEAAKPEVKIPEPPKPTANDGTIQIEHPEDEIHIDESGNFVKVSDMLKEMEEQAEAQKRREEEKKRLEAEAAQAAMMATQPPAVDPSAPSADMPASTPVSPGPSMVYEPPQFGGQLTANTSPVDQQYVSNPDPLINPGSQPMLSRDAPMTTIPGPSAVTADAVPTGQTLSDLEKSVNSPHTDQYQPLDSEPAPPPPLPTMGGLPAVNEAPMLQPPVTNNDVPPPPPEDLARDSVQRAVQGSNDYRPEPIAALNAQPLMPAPMPPTPSDQPSSTAPPVPPPFPMGG